MSARTPAGCAKTARQSIGMAPAAVAPPRRCKELSRYSANNGAASLHHGRPPGFQVRQSPPSLLQVRRAVDIDPDRTGEAELRPANLLLFRMRKHRSHCRHHLTGRVMLHLGLCGHLQSDNIEFTMKR